MNCYAIGKPNKEIRMIVTSADASHAALNCLYGEVFVEVPGKMTGKISKDGKSAIPAGVSMLDELWSIKEMRTALLAQCDHTVLPDSPFSPAERAAWAAYRTALRDITEDQPNTLFANIIWPEPPVAPG